MLSSGTADAKTTGLRPPQLRQGYPQSALRLPQGERLLRPQHHHRATQRRDRSRGRDSPLPRTRSASPRLQLLTYEWPKFICTISTILRCHPGAVPGDADGREIPFDSGGNPIKPSTHAFLDVCGCPSGPPCAVPPRAGQRRSTCDFGTTGGDGTPMGRRRRQRRRWTNGSTGWLRTLEPSSQARTIKLRFVVYDSKDHNVESAVLIDNWQWSGRPARSRPSFTAEVNCGRRGSDARFAAVKLHGKSNYHSAGGRTGGRVRARRQHPSSYKEFGDPVRPAASAAPSPTREHDTRDGASQLDFESARRGANMRVHRRPPVLSVSALALGTQCKVRLQRVRRGRWRGADLRDDRRRGRRTPAPPASASRQHRQRKHRASSPSADADLDGFTGNDGDCNDCDPMSKPARSRSSRAGRGRHDAGARRRGLRRRPGRDRGLRRRPRGRRHGSDLAARAVELCQMAGGKRLGVVSAQWVMVDGTPDNGSPNFHLGHGILNGSAPTSPCRAASGCWPVEWHSASATDPATMDVGGLRQGTTRRHPQGFTKESPALPGHHHRHPATTAPAGNRGAGPLQRHGFRSTSTSTHLRVAGLVCSTYKRFLRGSAQPHPHGADGRQHPCDSQGNESASTTPS